MSNFIDHYSVLDVCPSATRSELYSAYCQAVRLWLRYDPTFNHESLKCIQDSYRILQNPSKRRSFDAERIVMPLNDDNVKKNESKPHVTLPQLDENHNEEAFEAIKQDESPLDNDKLQQETLANYPESIWKLDPMQQEFIPHLYQNLHEKASSQNPDKLDEKHQFLQVINENPQYFNNMPVNGLPQYYENFQPSYIHQSQIHHYEYPLNQDPRQYFAHNQETAAQYYGYLQQTQPQCYEYTHQEKQSQYYGYAQEKQAQYENQHYYE